MPFSHKHHQLAGLKQLMKSLTHRSHDPTPSGSMPVYVGLERRRFLNLGIFITLLNKAKEEYGYQSSGGILLSCDVVLFEAVLDVLKRDERRFGQMEFEEFNDLFSDPGYLFESCKDSSDEGFGAPLLHKLIRV